MNGNPRLAVNTVLRLNHIVLNVSANSMLRSEECPQIKLRMLMQKVGGVLVVMVY
jgi:hypothetical protein